PISSSSTSRGTSTTRTSSAPSSRSASGASGSRSSGRTRGARASRADRRPLGAAGLRCYSWYDIRPRPNAPLSEDVMTFTSIRLGELRREELTPVRLRKEGYETQYHLERELGKPGWLVVLGDRTYFEGRVLRPDGSPAAGVPIRADGGPRRARGFMMGETLSE